MGFEIADIGLNEGRLGAARGKPLQGRFAVRIPLDIVHGDIEAGQGQGEGDGPADAAARAGDQGNFPLAQGPFLPSQLSAPLTDGKQ